MHLTVETVDESLWGNYSNETSSTITSHDALHFAAFYKMKFGDFTKLSLWPRVLLVMEQLKAIERNATKALIHVRRIINSMKSKSIAIKPLSYN